MNRIDALYLAAAPVVIPALAARSLRRGGWRAFWARNGDGDDLPDKQRPRIVVHAVSVGEVNAIRQLVRQLAESPFRPELIISATTATGRDRAASLFGDTHRVEPLPLDLSWTVGRFLDRIRPDLIATVELEVWPNLVRACHRRAIPIGVINGRLSARSFERYLRIRRLIQPAFRALDFAAVQNDTYAERFLALGAAPARIHVTDTMKWDAAAQPVDDADAARLARELGINPDLPLVVAGSTAPEEHELLRDAVPAGAQLLCAPRRPEWFDHAADVMPDAVRRTRAKGDASEPKRFILDTIGELSLAYTLADVVVVGRSFGERHGSDMLEPIARGKPTVIGPAVDDFREVMDVLLAAGGVLQVERGQLGQTIRKLLLDAEARNTLTRRGLDTVARHQGATRRHRDLLLAQLADPSHAPAQPDHAPTRP